LAKTVDEGFREFYGTLLPTREESQAAKSHGASIQACLKKNFGTTQFFPTGSFGNGTSIRGYSDVDYFACIPTENLKPNSFTTLQEVQKAISARFPKRKISLREPAVVVHFGDGISRPAEIVPAKLMRRKAEDKPIYEIANGSGNGGWQLSSPDVHNKYVREVNSEFDGKVKQLVSLLKAWKYYCDAQIKSFYLEIFVANYALQKKSIMYSKDVRSILASLWNNQLSALKDPKGISGYISPCSSEAQRSDALSKLEMAFKRAGKAREAEKAGKISDAFDWWDLVFAKNFPSYN